MRIKILCMTGCLLLASHALFASENVSDKAGTASAQFLKLGGTARSAALGGAFTAQADDVNALILNPGGLGFILNPEFQMMHAVWIEDMAYDYFGCVQPTPFGTFGLSAQYFGGPKIRKIRNGVLQEKFGNTDYAIGFGYGKALNDYFSLGLNLKNISSKLDGYSDTAQAVDLGILARTPNRMFTFGAAGENIGGGRLTYIKESDPIPYAVKTGVGLHLDMPQHYAAMNLLTEAVFPSDNDPYYVIGFEHWGGGIFALRAGYRIYTTDTNLAPAYNWKGGIGFNIKGLLIDYCYNPMGVLGNAQQFSVGYKFFGYVPVKKNVNASVNAEPLIFSPNGDAVRDTVFFTHKIEDIQTVSSWKLAIKNDKTGSVVKTFSGKKELPEIIVWDGLDSAGLLATEGVYSYDFSVKGEAGKVGSASGGGIVLDVTNPQVEITSSSGTFSPDGDGIDETMVFALDALDQNAIARWNITIMNVQSNKIVKVIKSTATLPCDAGWDGRDDYYNIVVPSGTYMVEFSAVDEAGNKAVAPLININLAVMPKLPKNIIIKETARGLIINMSSNVLYETGKSVLKPAAKSTLNEVMRILQAYPENNVLIEGHTDSVGSEKSNLDLSSARAWSVYSYLVKNGADPKRFSVKGWGESNPVASNKTKEGRAKNRRVEITILKKEEPVETLPPAEETPVEPQ